MEDEVDDLTDDELSVLQEWKEIVPEMMQSLRVNGIYSYGLTSDEMTMLLHEPGMSELYAALQQRAQELESKGDQK